MAIYAGHVADARLPDGLYAGAALFVFPSLCGKAPMVMCEAAASGTPSLLTASSSAAAVVCGGEKGLLAGDTTADMVARMTWTPDNPERLREIGAAARATVPKPWEDVAAEVPARYEDLIRTTQRTGHRKARARVRM